MSNQSTSSLTEAAKSLLQISFHKMGYAVQRYDPQENQSPGLAPLFEDPKEALCYQQGGKDAAFKCPIDRCVHAVGFGYGPGWNPFVATLQEHEHRSADYDSSLLKNYYQAWRPPSAKEAIAGFENAPSNFENLPSMYFLLSPWRSHTLAETGTAIKKWYKKDHKRSDQPLSVEKSGLKHFGPVSDEKGRFEFTRFTRVYESIKEYGYDRGRGDVKLVPLRRDDQFLYLLHGGHFHRITAVAALGYEAIPATFASPHCIDVKDVDYWPQVRRGVWPRQAAIDYFNHLFDFDSMAWARERGLLSEQVVS